MKPGRKKTNASAQGGDGGHAHLMRCDDYDDNDDDDDDDYVIIMMTKMMRMVMRIIIIQIWEKVRTIMINSKKNGKRRGHRTEMTTIMSIVL